MKRASPTMTKLGSLEEKVMAIVWEGGPLSVREVAAQLGGTLAYTTVMTTLDRLHTKALLLRTKDGNAFVYRPALSRDDFHRRLVEEAVTGLLATSAGAVLAAFVDTAVAVDEDNLLRLERLLAARRRARR